MYIIINKDIFDIDKFTHITCKLLKLEGSVILMYIFTSKSITTKLPDKICNQITKTILGYVLS